MGRKISALQDRGFRPDVSQTDGVQILLWFSDVVGAVGHQLDRDEEGDDSGDDQQHAGRDFTLAELVGGETGDEQDRDSPGKRRKNRVPAKCIGDFHSNPR